MLVVGVTCTLASRSFSISPSCYVLAKFNVSISFAVAFLQPFEPRHPFLSIGYRSSSPCLRSCQCLHGFAIVFLFISSPDPRSHPLNILRIYDSSLDSRSSLSSPSPSIVLFLGLVSRLHLFRRNLVFTQHHRYPISAFLSSLSISGVLAAQPASSFLASVHSTVVLLSVLSFHLD
jgi:hypothetical protein